MYKALLILLACSTFIDAQTRIINGNTVSIHDDTWRFIVSIKSEGDHYCGGSLIKPNWVLTAAHCVTDEIGHIKLVYPSDTVGSGSYNLNEMKDYPVKRYIVHPGYDSETVDNDIALIELKTPITDISPIPWDTRHPLTEGTQTKVAGWGDTGGAYPNDLKEALVPIVDFNTCNSSTSYDGKLTENMICAGYFDGRKDSCQGDSGGPLIVDGLLVGIVSWGEGCAQKNFPGVYTKVQNYHTWILQITQSSTITTNWVPVIVDSITVMIPAYPGK